MGCLMNRNAPHDVTLLLQDWCRGEREALDKLIPLVYDELRRTAHRYIARERPGRTLQTTALVNEAYMRLIDAGRVQWEAPTQDGESFVYDDLPLPQESDLMLVVNFRWSARWPSASGLWNSLAGNESIMVRYIPALTSTHAVTVLQKVRRHE